MKMKNYNTTDLNPQQTFERHVYHRDQFAHYLRWTHILKEARIGDRVCDFGCGNAALLEVFYRNRFKCESYCGIDIREKVINDNKDKFKNVEWAEFFAEDLVKPSGNVYFEAIQADKVCSFEVIEHVGKNNGEIFLDNFKKCGHKDSIYYLSTPNYDEKVGAAGNHTYDSGDGLGNRPHEYTHEELQDLLISSGFKIINKFGTFASMKDYKSMLNDWQIQMFENLKLYYDTNLISNLMAPFFPEQSRNCLWILKQKP